MSKAHEDNFINRLHVEQGDLDEKITKLTSFIDTPVFKTLGPKQQVLRKMQLRTMETYSFILNEVIENVENPY